jgi:iron complex transport system permease protein
MPVRSTPGYGGLLIGLSAALVVSVGLATAIGPVRLSPQLVGRVGLSHVAPSLVTPDWTSVEESIVWEIRLPRVLLAAIVGASLAVVGATLQALLQNPLADPYLLGVSAGASFGAVLALLTGVAWLGMLSVPLVAFIGSLAASVLVYAFARGGGRLTTGRLILAGVAVSYVLSASTNLLINLASHGEEVRSATFWMLGGLGGAHWSMLALPLSALVAGTALLLVQGRALTALSISEETAATLGVDADRVRRLCFAVTSLLTGAVVALSGGIGFVGLVVPHAARGIVGAVYNRLLPVAALIGAIFLIWVDVLARTLLAPQELPIGIITALLGAPFFLVLMRRSPGALGNGR